MSSTRRLSRVLSSSRAAATAAPSNKRPATPVTPFSISPGNQSDFADTGMRLQAEPLYHLKQQPDIVGTPSTPTPSTSHHRPTPDVEWKNALDKSFLRSEPHVQPQQSVNVNRKRSSRGRQHAIHLPNEIDAEPLEANRSRPGVDKNASQTIEAHRRARRSASNSRPSSPVLDGSIPPLPEESFSRQHSGRSPPAVPSPSTHSMPSPLLRQASTRDASGSRTHPRYRKVEIEPELSHSPFSPPIPQPSARRVSRTQEYQPHSSPSEANVISYRQPQVLSTPTRPLWSDDNDQRHTQRMEQDLVDRKRQRSARRSVSRQRENVSQVSSAHIPVDNDHAPQTPRIPPSSPSPSPTSFFHSVLDAPTTQTPPVENSPVSSTPQRGSRLPPLPQTPIPPTKSHGKHANESPHNETSRQVQIKPPSNYISSKHRSWGMEVDTSIASESISSSAPTPGSHSATSPPAPTSPHRPKRLKRLSSLPPESFPTTGAPSGNLRHSASLGRLVEKKPSKRSSFTTSSNSPPRPAQRRSLLGKSTQVSGGVTSSSTTTKAIPGRTSRPPSLTIRPSTMQGHIPDERNIFDLNVVSELLSRDLVSPDPSSSRSTLTSFSLISSRFTGGIGLERTNPSTEHRIQVDGYSKRRRREYVTSISAKSSTPGSEKEIVNSKYGEIDQGTTSEKYSELKNGRWPTASDRRGDAVNYASSHVQPDDRASDISGDYIAVTATESLSSKSTFLVDYLDSQGTPISSVQMVSDDERRHNDLLDGLGLNIAGGIGNLAGLGIALSNDLSDDEELSCGSRPTSGGHHEPSPDRFSRNHSRLSSTNTGPISAEYHGVSAGIMDSGSSESIYSDNDRDINDISRDETIADEHAKLGEDDILSEYSEYESFFHQPSVNVATPHMDGGSASEQMNNVTNSLSKHTSKISNPDPLSHSPTSTGSDWAREYNEDSKTPPAGMQTLPPVGFNYVTPSEEQDEISKPGSQLLDWESGCEESSPWSMDVESVDLSCAATQLFARLQGEGNAVEQVVSSSVEQLQPIQEGRSGPPQECVYSGSSSIQDNQMHHPFHSRGQRSFQPIPTAGKSPVSEGQISRPAGRLPSALRHRETIKRQENPFPPSLPEEQQTSQPSVPFQQTQTPRPEAILSSTFDDLNEHLMSPRPAPSPGQRTWRSTLNSAMYKSLLERHGPFEMRRQEIIWELCETEMSFVKSLKLVLKLFVQPLRIPPPATLTPSTPPHPPSWIPGLPGDATRLFDWLDDIVQLHSQISSALHAARSTQYPIVLEIAEHLRPFVPRLEIHQPYLVRLENVMKEIEVMLRDPASDFGEFLRIQSSSPECGNLGLTSYLLKPVQRLMKYPLFFRHLWEQTPRDHPDHLATFSLFHSTDLMIRVLQEVKGREEEYELVKELATRVKGLPAQFRLARRERRLIMHGLLSRVNLSEKERSFLDGADTRMDLVQNSKARPSETASIPLGADISKLMPITYPDVQFKQPAPHVPPPPPLPPSYDPRYQPRRSSSASRISFAASEASFSSGRSSISHSTTSSIHGMSCSETGWSLRPDSDAFSLHEDLPLDEHKFLPHMDQRTGHSNDTRSRPLSFKGASRSKIKETLVYVFVFSDLVLITTPINEKQGLLRSPKSEPGGETWRLLEEIGISRVLGVTNHSGRLSHDHLIELELLPVPLDQPDNDVVIESISCAAPVYLSLSEHSNPRMGLAPKSVLTEARSKWISAFERCFLFTLRSLSFPPSYLSNLDSANDLTSHSRHSVLSILASGLPLPKSLSQQMIDDGSFGDNSVIQEREERGWWRLRFKQVLREMERYHSPTMLAFNTGLDMALSIPQRSRKTKHLGLDRVRRAVETKPLRLASSSTTGGRKLLSLSRKK